jgi:hypothetical protein
MTDDRSVRLLPRIPSDPARSIVVPPCHGRGPHGIDPPTRAARDGPGEPFSIIPTDKDNTDGAGSPRFPVLMREAS